MTRPHPLNAAFISTWASVAREGRKDGSLAPAGATRDASIKAALAILGHARAIVVDTVIVSLIAIRAFEESHGVRD